MSYILKNKDGFRPVEQEDVSHMPLLNAKSSNNTNIYNFFKIPYDCAQIQNCFSWNTFLFHVIDKCCCVCFLYTIKDLNHMQLQCYICIAIYT